MDQSLITALDALNGQKKAVSSQVDIVEIAQGGLDAETARFARMKKAFLAQVEDRIWTMMKLFLSVWQMKATD